MIPEDDETMEAFVTRAKRRDSRFRVEQWLREHGDALRSEYPKKKIWTELPALQTRPADESGGS